MSLEASRAKTKIVVDQTRHSETNAAIRIFIQA